MRCVMEMYDLRNYACKVFYVEMDGRDLPCCLLDGFEGSLREP